MGADTPMLGKATIATTYNIVDAAIVISLCM